MDLIKKYFSGLNPRQIAQLEALEPLYRQWNNKINLISRKDIDNFYSRHVLHSMVIAKFIDFKPGSVIVDAGTGGGFPGLPLAILFPECNFILVDSTQKKLKAVDDIANKIELNNIKTIHSRIEDLNLQCDFVVSRAVSRLDTMWGWSSKLLSKTSVNDKKNGLIYLKGGDISAEAPNNTFIQKIDLNELIKSTVFTDKALIYIANKQG